MFYRRRQGKSANEGLPPVVSRRLGKNLKRLKQKWGIKRMRETMFQERVLLSRLHLNIIDQKVWMKAVYDPLAGSITYGYLPKFALA